MLKQMPGLEGLSGLQRKGWILRFWVPCYVQTPNPKPNKHLKESDTPSPKPRARMEGHAEVHGSGSHRRLDECISKSWTQGLGLEGLGVIGFGGLGFRVQLFFCSGLQGFLVH